MSLAALAGRTFAPTEPYEVTREGVADFAASIGASYEDGPAPATFPIVVAFAAIRSLVDDPASGLALPRIVHGEQRFSYHRPVRPGDVLTAELTVETVRSIAAADYLRTVSEIRDQQGEPVVTAWATLVHRGVADHADGLGPSLPGPREAR